MSALPSETAGYEASSPEDDFDETPKASLAESSAGLADTWESQRDSRGDLLTNTWHLPSQVLPVDKWHNRNQRLKNHHPAPRNAWRITVCLRHGGAEIRGKVSPLVSSMVSPLVSSTVAPCLAHDWMKGPCSDLRAVLDLFRAVFAPLTHQIAQETTGPWALVAFGALSFGDYPGIQFCEAHSYQLHNCRSLRHDARVQTTKCLHLIFARAVYCVTEKGIYQIGMREEQPMEEPCADAYAARYLGLLLQEISMNAYWPLKLLHVRGARRIDLQTAPEDFPWQPLPWQAKIRVEAPKDLPF